MSTGPGRRGHRANRESGWRARRLLQQPVEDVADNAVNGRVARFQPIRPVTAADGDHGAVAGIGADGAKAIQDARQKSASVEIRRVFRKGLRSRILGLGEVHRASGAGGMWCAVQ